MTLVSRLVLLLTALFAVFWAILRACVQSLTIDESDTYLFFVYRELSWVWWPDANNHVLNSGLMWMMTHSFGPHHITVRAPALLGAVLYIVSCYSLCRSLTNRFSLQLPLFICLTFNPFVFDYLVAARGYGLAVAFLMAAIAILMWHSSSGGPSLRMSCCLASLALGLSFSANFSFAFVDAAAFLALVAWAVTQKREESIFRIVGYCAVPGLLLTLLICGYPLMNWKKGALWYGSKSLGEMTESLVKPSLYQLAPRFRGSGLYLAMNSLKPLLLPLFGILCICQVAMTLLDGTWRRDDTSRRMGRFAMGLAGIATLAVLVHWIAFHFFGLPLPRARTGVYLAPLLTLLGGVIASASARSMASRWLQLGITGVLICLACYFMLCLRLTYFDEWKWDADVKDVYTELARYNHTYGVEDVGMTWWYVASLNYYRVVSKAETFPNFIAPIPYPPDKKWIYVLHGLFDRDFLKQEKLVVVYRGRSTDVVVAVRPGGPIPAIRIDP
jgi:hypothetical protein